MVKQIDKLDNKSNVSKLIRIFPFMEGLFNNFPWLVQFVNFGIVGLSNTVVAYSVYAVLVYYNLHPQIANIISFMVSVLNAYIWNRVWVFSGHQVKKVSTPFKFIVVYGGNLLLGILLLYLYLNVWHLNKYIAPFISLPVTVPLNYILNKLWVFRE